MSKFTRSKSGKLTSDKPYVSDEDLLDLESTEGLPYLRCVELSMCTPQQFGLDKWKAEFRIPDLLMKKIYKNEIYRDTEVPEREPEKISSLQKKVLHEWLRQRRYCEENTPLSIHKESRANPTIDCLLEQLESSNGTIEDAILDRDRLEKRTKSNQDVQGPNPPLIELNSENIAICTKHKVQPEDIIVKLALQKMKNLSPKEESEYQELLKNRHFMQYLNDHVEQYVMTNVDFNNFVEYDEEI